MIYAFGVAWLPHALDLTVRPGLDRSACVRFLPGDAIKILLAAGLLPAAWKLVDAIRR